MSSTWVIEEKIYQIHMRNIRGGLHNSEEVYPDEGDMDFLKIMRISTMTKEYLEALAPEARADQDLAVEIGLAYLLLARVQGVPTTPNLGQYAEAEQSLRQADAL